MFAESRSKEFLFSSLPFDWPVIRGKWLRLKFATGEPPPTSRHISRWKLIISAKRDEEGRPGKRQVPRWHGDRQNRGRRGVSFSFFFSSSLFVVHIVLFRVFRRGVTHSPNSEIVVRSSTSVTLSLSLPRLVSSRFRPLANISTAINAMEF